MKTPSLLELESLVENCRAFFRSGRTRDLSFRRARLEELARFTETHEKQIYEALKRDLGKNENESFLGEVMPVKTELRLFLKKLSSWAKPLKKPTSPVNFPGRSKIVSQPYGVVLILSPWNYPFQLAMVPLLSALAAGNCAVIKLSEYAPATSELLRAMAADYFEPGLLTVLDGGADEADMLLRQKFDYIFFTGSTAVGRKVMARAADSLTPVTLELGGKSPCILHRVKDMETAVRRILWGKFFNAGQTCVAPDYLFVLEEDKERFASLTKKILLEFYGENPQESEGFARIINDKHFRRLEAFLHEGHMIAGGTSDAGSRYIAPTVLDGVGGDAAVMQEEIFGPLLPVFYYRHLGEVIERINARPKPLALYLFSDDGAARRRVVELTSSGGLCINDVLVHFTSPQLPFGGVGDSGMGAYHGKAGFDTFSHKKSVLERGFAFDAPFKYPQAGALARWLKNFIIRVG